MKPTSLLALLLTIPPVQAAWKPVEGRIMTRWAKELTPANAWDEYPRPQLQRENWTNLNGLWSYATTDWLRLTIPTPEDEPRSRWPVHPLAHENPRVASDNGSARSPTYTPKPE